MAKITDYGVRADLMARLQATPKSQGLLALAMFISSELAAGQSEKYAWLGTTPSMREWIGERLRHNPQAFDLQIVNKKFENGLHIPLDLVNNDKTDAVSNLVADFADTYNLWYKEILSSLINNGTTLNAFDGQPFFSAAHQWGKMVAFANTLNQTTVSNTAITAMEAALGVNKLIEMIRSFPDDQGRPIANESIQEITLVYQAGTANAGAIKAAATNQTLSNGTGMVDNPLKGQDIKINWISSGLITTGQTKITAFRPASDRGKAIIFQENQNDFMPSYLASGSDYVVANDGWFFGLKAVGNAGFGMPNHAAQLTFV